MIRVQVRRARSRTRRWKRQLLGVSCERVLHAIMCEGVVREAGAARCTVSAA